MSRADRYRADRNRKRHRCQNTGNRCHKCCHRHLRGGHMFYCCLFHLCFPPNVHHFCRRILNSIVLKFCIPVRISQNGIVLDRFFSYHTHIPRICQPIFIIWFTFLSFLFTSFFPIIFLCAIYPPSKNMLYSMYSSSHRQLGEFSSYQLSVQSSVRMHHRCAARVLYARHKEIHFMKMKSGNERKNHPGTPEQD